MATSGSFNTTDYDGRYLTFAWVLISQSYETNSTVISWSLTGAGQGGATWYKAGSFKVIINGVVVYLSAQRINLYNGTAVASGQFTIEHDNDGNKTFSASAEAAIHLTEVNCQGSSSWSLPTIERYASITSTQDFTDEENPSFNYVNPLGDDVVSLQANIKYNGQYLLSWVDINTNSTSYTFELTSADRTILRNLIPSSNSVVLIVDLKTVIGLAEYHSPAYITMSIVNGEPLISGISYQDTNDTTYAITGNRQRLIQGKSTARISISSLSAIKGASLSSIAVTINSITRTASIAGTSLNNFVFDFGTIDSSDSIPGEILITDSRGNSSTATLNLVMLAYSTPEALISCARRGNYYNDTNLTVNAQISSLDGNNEATIEYQYQESGSETWSALTEIADGVTETINLSNTSVWLIRVIVTDRLESATFNMSIAEGTPLVFFDRAKKSLSVNCLPQYENSFELNGDDPFNYHEGDTIELSDYYLSGIALSDTSIKFTIKLDKIIGENDISFSELAITVISGGSSADYANFLGVGSVNIVKASETSITITAILSGSTYPVTADTIVGVVLTGTISFVAPSPITWDYELSNIELDGQTATSTNINPFSAENITRNWEMLINAETQETALNGTTIGIFGQDNAGSGNQYYIQLILDPDGLYPYYRGKLSGTAHVFPCVIMNKDIHIVKNNTEIAFYVDGVLMTTCSITDTTGSTRQKLEVGYWYGGVGTYYFKGHLNYFKFRFTS